ncbi:putative esterase [Trypanosoma conorhini]|uniref:Putative esterase n=1 Tax=Trypanosoma conorhini TaxID=83891 RepID=A0A422PN84_9TRYP|nr:putative esterase [Trypanosoma conorhini]RNF19172.1 putative esterase [Trypanosoma conorhini]
MRTAILLGDSLTEQGYFSGWAAQLSERYVRRADVLNRGLSGYNTRWVLDILNDDERRRHLLPPHIGQPLFVTLMLGSNDCAGLPQYVPLEEYRVNLKAIVRLVREHVAPVGGLFLMSPPPLDEEGRLTWLRSVGREPDSCKRSFENVRRYRDAALQVGAEEYAEHGDVFTVDLHLAFLGAGADTTPYAKGPWCGNFVDGLHFNGDGGRIVFEALWSAIAKSARADKIMPDGLPYVLPPWDALASSTL